jgi:hypothetical protein
MGAWTWAGASVIGTSHQWSGTRRQDAYRCIFNKGTGQHLVCVVADGAGSSEYGGEGASLVCRTITRAAEEHILKTGSLPTEDDVQIWVDVVRDRISFAASKRGKAPRDFAATMITVLSSGHETALFQVGDGCAVFKDAISGEWVIPLWPDHGEYASTTSFVTDDPAAKCRYYRHDERISAAVVMTDGLERLALDLHAKRPFTAFFDGISRPLLSSEATGKDQILSTALRSYLAGESICARTDDDKTLVIAVKK